MSYKVTLEDCQTLLAGKKAYKLFKAIREETEDKVYKLLGDKHIYMLFRRNQTPEIRELFSFDITVLSNIPITENLLITDGDYLTTKYLMQIPSGDFLFIDFDQLFQLTGTLQATWDILPMLEFEDKFYSEDGDDDDDNTEETDEDETLEDRIGALEARQDELEVRIEYLENANAQKIIGTKED